MSIGYLYYCVSRRQNTNTQGEQGRRLFMLLSLGYFYFLPKGIGEMAFARRRAAAVCNWRGERSKFIRGIRRAHQYPGWPPRSLHLCNIRRYLAHVSLRRLH